MPIQAISGRFEGTGPRTVLRPALVVSGTEKGRTLLKTLLEGSVYRPAAFAGSGGEARRVLLSTELDAVLVNAPLPDEFGQELACLAAEEGKGALLVVKRELFAEAANRVGPCGVFTLAKPASREEFSRVLDLLGAWKCREEKLIAENRRLLSKLEEVKLVCRAKCLLTEREGISEAEAHRRIEKLAMDRRTTRRAVAEELLRCDLSEEEQRRE